MQLSAQTGHRGDALEIAVHGLLIPGSVSVFSQHPLEHVEDADRRPDASAILRSPVRRCDLTRSIRPDHGFPLRQRPGGQDAPLDPSPRRQLGFLQGSVDEAFFEP